MNQESRFKFIYYAELVELIAQGAEPCLIASESGFEVLVPNSEDLDYVLCTIRNTVRYFKSPATAINYLVGAGARNVSVQNLKAWNVNSYVNQSSRPKVKKVKADKPKAKN